MWEGASDPLMCSAVTLTSADAIRRCRSSRSRSGTHPTGTDDGTTTRMASEFFWLQLADQA